MRDRIKFVDGLSLISPSAYAFFYACARCKGAIYFKDSRYAYFEESTFHVTGIFICVNCASNNNEALKIGRVMCTLKKL